MSEPLGIMADIIAAIIVMFIFPVLSVMGLQDKLEDRYIRSCVREFTEDVCCAGCIDEAVYEAFSAKIALTGKRRTIDITSTSLKYEPVYENGIFTGKVSEFEETASKEEILEDLIGKGSYLCRYGDILSVSVYDSELSLITCSGMVKGRRQT